MSKICLPSTHPFYASTGSMQKICEPLFEQHQFTFFDYVRAYSNGDFYALSVNNDSIRLFFELEYQLLSHCNNMLIEDNKLYYYFSTPSMMQDDASSYLLNAINKVTGADHGFCVYRKNLNYVDAFYFSSSRPFNIAVNYYANQIQFINSFVKYFQHEAGRLLFNANENRIVLPDKMIPKILKSCTHDVSSINKSNSIDNCLLTKRELECIKYFCKGYTTNEAANALFISPRTVEVHLSNIKNKLHLRKKSHVIKYIISNPHLYNL